MTDYTELKRLAEAAQYENCEFQHELVAATKAFFVGCIPEQILALIAENDSTRKHWQNESNNVQALMAEVLRLNAECEHAKLIGRIAYNFDGYKAVLDERDQLRAEVAGLKTGYEAYKRVNAELKAENEELRANSSLVVLLPKLDSVLEDLEIHGQHSDQGYRKLKDWYRKVDLACKAIDAAMGKGSQS